MVVCHLTQTFDWISSHRAQILPLLFPFVKIHQGWRCSLLEDPLPSMFMSVSSSPILSYWLYSFSRMMYLNKFVLLSQFLPDLLNLPIHQTSFFLALKKQSKQQRKITESKIANKTKSMQKKTKYGVVLIHCSLVWGLPHSVHTYPVPLS